MTLDELTRIVDEARTARLRDLGNLWGATAAADRAAVLAVLQAVKRECVPQELDWHEIGSWNDCVEEINQRIDALMQDSPPRT